MAKIRVYELARELKLESKALLAKLKDLGISVAGHQSTLTLAQVEKVKADQAAGDKPKVVIRRRRKAATPEVELPPTSELTAEPVVVEEGSSSEQVAASHLSVDQPASEVTGVADSSSKLEEPIVSGKPEIGLGDLSEASAKDSVVVPDDSLNAVEEPSAAPEPVVAEVRNKKLNPPTLTRSYSPKEVQFSSEAEKLREEAEKAKALAEKGARTDRERSSAVPRTSSGSSDRAVVQESKRTAPKSGTGATIVRRATEQEVQETRSREEARQKTSRREDSRGVRVTGIGVSTRMGAPETDEGEVRDRWGKEKRESRRSGSDHEEEERPQSRSTPNTGGKRRGSLSTRDLLEAAADPEDYTDPAVAAANKRRRTVYTPQASHKKKDLRRRKDLKSTQITTPRAAYRVVRCEGSYITVADLAHQLCVKAGELIKKLMSQGVMVTLNQTIDIEVATLICADYGYEVKDVSRKADEVLVRYQQERSDEGSRPPIITVMGHVDHGKTSILDAIRKTDVVASEAGGITQHIGAYSIQHNDFSMTFLDTPGHEAFSAMRARGAMLTDIVVLVVAADDGVMPQTLEAISHAKSAEVPIIVAVNKIDKPNKNLDRIYTELAEHGVQSEEWGGDTQFVKVSAINREGIDNLLESIHLQAEILELKAKRKGTAEGVVVEAHLDKGQGPVATLIVTEGELQVGDYVVAGKVTGRVRAMHDHNRKRLKSAGPSIPAEIVGLASVPMSGDRVYAVPDEKSCKELAQLFDQERVAGSEIKSGVSSLEELIGKVKTDELPEVPVILKADTQGSCEAIVESLMKLNANKKVRCTVVHRGVGGINESDLNLADTSKAIVVGFNVRAMRGLEDVAEERGVAIRYFSIIYELVDFVKLFMAGKLPPNTTEVVQGHAEVRDAISVPKVGTIAGSSVLDGKITRGAHLRLIRNDVVIFSGRIASLRRFKDDVKEVTHGYECGISIDGYNDVKVGDMIEAFLIEETAATLDI